MDKERGKPEAEQEIDAKIPEVGNHIEQEPAVRRRAHNGETRIARGGISSRPEAVRENAFVPFCVTVKSTFFSMAWASATDRPVPVLLLARELSEGGSERQLCEVAKNLNRDRFEPHTGSLRAGGMRADELRAAGVPCVSFEMHSYLRWGLARGLARLLRYIAAHGIRLVHAFDMPVQPFAIAGGRLAGCPVVLASQRAHRELAEPLHRPLLRMSDLVADGIVVNCEFVRRHLREDEGVADSRIHVCYNGVDLERFRRAASKPPELAEGRVTVGVVCALRPEKDLRTLVEAFARAGGGQKGIRLAIVGSGPEEAGLRELARVRGVAADCVFAAATPRVAEWLSGIDIFVLPSRSEAFSNSLMEAMACGCCAVASRVGGNPELIRDMETGLLFEAGNVEQLAGRLALLIEDPGLRQRLAEAGMSRIRTQFSIRESACRMGAIYGRMLQRAGVE